MSEKPPFPNLYKLKHVSEGTSACTICYRPTDAVLLSIDKKDWFYVCEIHLKDKNFALLVYADDEGKRSDGEWKTLCDNVGKLKTSLRDAEKKVKDKENAGKSWLGWGRGKDGEGEGEGKGEERGMGVEDIRNQLKDAENKLVAFEKEHIKYVLQTTFYKNRLLSEWNRRKAAETRAKVLDGTLFPSLEGLQKLGS